MLRRAAARRRDDDERSSVSDQHHLRHHHHQQQQQQQQGVEEQSSVGVRERIEMLVRYVIASRSLYAQLPDRFCASESLSAGHYDVCWNGTALAPSVFCHILRGADFLLPTTTNHSLPQNRKAPWAEA